MAASKMAEAFTLVGGKEYQETVFEDFENQQSGKTINPSLTLLASVRAHHPDMTVAVTSANNVPLLRFAAAGFATAELDLSENDILRARIFLRPVSIDDNGTLADSTTFARYNYTWKGLKFIMYNVFIYPQIYQLVCFPPDSDETVLSNSKATDALLLAAGRAYYGPYQGYIAVFDFYWRPDTELYKEVQKTSWSDVILDQGMKDTISFTIEEFFDNESRYRDLDVPWKRGIIFHGPPGNGKTLSLRALMHSLITHSKQRPKPINLLYVKSIRNTNSIRSIFTFARFYAPCLLIIEDIDTQVTPEKLSYFFNEVDGLENNDGILMIATTNHLDRLDEGLKRPSRFDRRYLFPLPELGERTQYAEFWRKKLERNGAKVEFPQELSERIAGITAGFSFATMKEAFVATLLTLARNGDEDKGFAVKDKGHEGIDELPLWKEIQVQVKLLRKEMGKTKQTQMALLGDLGGDSLARPDSRYRDPRVSSPGHEAPVEFTQEPVWMIDGATGLQGGYDTNHPQRFRCQRGSDGPLQIQNPPPAIKMGPFTPSTPNLIAPVLGAGDSALPRGSTAFGKDFPEIEGQADVRDVERKRRGGYDTV